MQESFIKPRLYQLTMNRGKIPPSG